MEAENSERWQAIDDYENYEISTHGRVKNNISGKIIKNSLSKTYYKVNLYKNKQLKTVDVHKLVCCAFVENINNYPQIDHIDRNPLNNNFENLRWCSPSQNQKNKNQLCNNTSGIKGVRFIPDRNKWSACWTENKIRKMKRFDSKDEAINYRKEMELLHEYS
jgi:hypothetical protein